MQIAQIRVKHQEDSLQTVFITITTEDKILFDRLSKSDETDKQEIAAAVTKQIIHLFHLQQEILTVALEKYIDVFCIAAVLNKHLTREEMSRMIEIILPQACETSCWQTYSEEDILQTIESVCFSPPKATLSALYIFKIPSVRSLLQFKNLRGYIIEQGINLYLCTPDNLCDFFDEQKENQLSTNLQSKVIIKDVAKLLELFD